MMTVSQSHSLPKDFPSRSSLRAHSEGDDSSSDDSSDSELSAISPPRISVDLTSDPSYSRLRTPSPLRSIFRIEKLAEVLPIIGENLARTTIFQDIDETALHLVRGGIDYRDLVRWANEKLQSGFCSHEEASRLNLWALNTFPPVPVEPISLDLCRRLQATAKAYIYLTARNASISKLTQKHLGEFPPGLRIPGVAPEGVYFTNATSKAKAIQHLNKVSEVIRASEIFVLIDDNFGYLEPVASECADLGKTVLCLYYAKPYIPNFPSDEAVNTLLAEDGLRPFTTLRSGDLTL